MLVPINFEGNDVFEYAAFLGMRDKAVFGKRNPFTFSNGHNKYLQVELRNCYDMGYDLEEVSSELYLSMNIGLKMFIREWNDLVGWGTLEGVFNGHIKKLPFSYHNLAASMADQPIEHGQVLNVVYQILDEKIVSLTL